VQVPGGRYQRPSGALTIRPQRLKGKTIYNVLMNGRGRNGRILSARFHLVVGARPRRRRRRSGPWLERTERAVKGIVGKRLTYRAAGH
jgi:hypothetical protein